MDRGKCILFVVFAKLSTLNSQLSTLFVVLLLTPTFTQAAVTDIDDYPHKSAIQLLESRGIVDGYPNGTFVPNKAINRAEFLKLLMLSVYGDQAQQGGSERCFADFTGNYAWFWSHACTAKKLGVIHGHPDGTFRGEDTIILAEALKMSFEAWKVPLGYDDPNTPWYQRYMDAAAPRGIFRRFPFTPDYQLTRGEMALLLVMIGEPIASLTGEPQEIGDVIQVEIPLPTKIAVCGNGKKEGTEQCDDGNTENGDGCSKACILVAEPIRHGALRIEQQTISSNPQASGNNDVPLFAFTAIAGRQDVYITNLKFTSAAGSLDNAENYRILIDRDGDGIVETLYGRAVPSGEIITFAEQNILVKDGAYIRVELWADIITTFTAGNIAVAFATSQSDFVEGVDKIDGEDVTGIKLNDDDCTLSTICWITVITDTDQTVTINTQGNLFVSQGSTPLGSRQVIASTETPSLLHLKFRADAEDVIVKELAIEGVPSTVEYLSFYTDGSTSPFAKARLVDCSTVVTGRFCTDTDFTIPKSGERMITVKALLKPDELGAVSGQSVALSVSAATSSTVAIEAQGFYSGQQLSQNDGSASGDGEIFVGTESVASNSLITAPSHTVVLAKIVDVTNSNPDPDNSLINEGEMMISQFAFRAADHNNASSGYNEAEITKLVITVSAVNVAFDAGEFVLLNTQNLSVVSACTASTTTGTISVTCDNLDSSAVSTQISRGDTIHLTLRGTITDSQIDSGTSILQSSLQNLSNPGVTGTITWTDEETSFGWVDIGKTTVKSTVYRLD